MQDTRFAKARRSLNRLLAREEGSISIETALFIPLLIFLFVAGYTYFDGYRRDATMSKATYAVADLLSRRRDVVTDFDLDGLENIYETIVFSGEDDSYMRFSEIRLVPEDEGGGLEVVWTHATDNQPELTNNDLRFITGRIPPLDENKRILLVEAYTYDNPAFNVFLPDRVIDTFQPIGARYEECIVYSPDGTDPGGCLVAGGGTGATSDDEAGTPVGG